VLEVFDDVCSLFWCPAWPLEGSEKVLEVDEGLSQVDKGAIYGGRGGLEPQADGSSAHQLIRSAESFVNFVVTGFGFCAAHHQEHPTRRIQDGADGLQCGLLRCPDTVGALFSEYALGPIILEHALPTDIDLRDEIPTDHAGRGAQESTYHGQDEL
jgi:hypothetical protein